MSAALQGVPALIDPRIAVLPLVTALASAGLTIRHDPKRNALLIVPVQSVHS